MASISKTQAKLLRYIEEYVKNHGYGPSTREILAAMNWKSTSTVDYHIKVLKEKNLIRHDTRTARSIRVTGQEKASTYLTLFISAVEAAQGKEPDLLPLGELLYRVQTSRQLSPSIWAQVLQKQLPPQKL